MYKTFVDRQKQEERRQLEETRAEGFKEKDRKRKVEIKIESFPKIKKSEEGPTVEEVVLSPRSEVYLLNINIYVDVAFCFT